MQDTVQYRVKAGLIATTAADWHGPEIRDDRLRIFYVMALSGPHQKFAEGIAAGLNQTEAYQAAYPKSANSTARARATALAANSSIIAAIADLRERSTREFSMTRAEWLESFVRIGKKAETAKDFGAAKGCMREIGLALPGWYSPANVQVEGEVDIVIRIGT